MAVVRHDEQDLFVVSACLAPGMHSIFCNATTGECHDLVAQHSLHDDGAGWAFLQPIGNAPAVWARDIIRKVLVKRDDGGMEIACLDSKTRLGGTQAAA